MEEKKNTGARAAILKAAKRMFAARGFRAATVRDICADAEANIALVSRHFGSKRGLYAEVCRSLFDGLAAPLARLDVGISTADEWREALRKWIGHALRLTSATRSPENEIAGIFRQEMFDPSPMREYLRTTFMMPIFNCLRRLVEMGGSGSESDTLAHMTRIWSQISFYALLGETWQTPFRPAGVPRATWLSQIAEGIAAETFGKLEFTKR